MTAAAPPPLYLVLDQGGHASRALVFDPCGALVASAFVEIATQYPAPEHVEHDGDELVASLESAATRAIDALGDRAAHIAAAGLATQRSSIVCWNRTTGAPLSPVISWQDRRAADWLQAFDAQRDDVHERTGLMLSPHYGASKLRWCVDHLDAVQSAAQNGDLAYGPLASFLTFRLTRERMLCADPANGGRTLLWNRHTHQWDPQLSQLFGVPLTHLPPCTASRGEFGHLRVRGIPLHIVTGDQSAAVFAYGEPTTDRILINIGTGAFAQFIHAGREAATPRLLHSVVFADEQSCYGAIEGTVNGAGSAVAWWAEQDHQPDWPEHAAFWLADERPPPLFINGVGGVGSPFWLPRLPSRFFGDGDAGQRFRAVVESIVFLLQCNLQEFAAAGIQAREIWVSGGWSAHDPVCQWLADLGQRPVTRTRETEATGRGVAWLLAHNGRPEAFSATLDRQFLPRPNDGLLQRFHQWRAAMAQAGATTDGAAGKSRLT